MSAEAEARPWAAIRDICAGLALLAIGALVGGSSLGAEPDGADIAFDVLGAGWVLFGAGRLVWWMWRRRGNTDSVD